MRSKKWAVIAAILLAVMIGLTSAVLSMQNELVPDDPINGIHEDRSQGLVTGKGYAMDKEKKQDYKKQKEEEEKKEAEQEEQQQESPSDEYQETDEPELSVPTDEEDEEQESDLPVDPDNGDKESEGDLPVVPEDPELPTIKTNLTNGQEVGGGYIGFWVKATDYKGRYIDASGLDLKLNGTKIYSSGDTGSKVNYGADIADGENILEITATDSYGKSRTLVYTLVGNSDKEGEVEGTITFSLEAHTVGLGYLIAPVEVEVQMGKPFPYTLKTILDNYGFGMAYKGSLNTGFYLQEVMKPGITNGCQIPEELQQRLDEEGTDKKSHDADSLGEADFTKFSGWIYQVNGSSQSAGMSSYIPKDGDEIRIRFSLWYGEDIGGSWGDW